MTMKSLGIALVIVCAVHLGMPSPRILCAGENPSLPASSLSGEGLRADFSVDAGFTSNLPLLVLDLHESDAAVPELTGTISVYDKPNGVNSLLDAPTTVAAIVARKRAGQPENGKASYVLRLVDDGKPLSLAGLPEDAQWVLHGSVRDKGMLRNGLALELGRELFQPSAPQTAFCEVLIGKDGEYRYDGIHILAERPEHYLAGLAVDADTFLIEYSPRADRLGE